MTELKWTRPRPDMNRWEGFLGELKMATLTHSSAVVLSDAQAARTLTSFALLMHFGDAGTFTLPVSPLCTAKLRAEQEVTKALEAAGLVREVEPEPILADKLTRAARWCLDTVKADRWPQDDEGLQATARTIARTLTEVVHRYLADELSYQRPADPEALVLEELLTAIEELGDA